MKGISDCVRYELYLWRFKVSGRELQCIEVIERKRECEEMQGM
jgi:hypothetical protein